MTGLSRIAPLLLITAALGCGQDELQPKLIEGPPEVLAEILPASIFSSPAPAEGMLPATKTTAETVAEIKADGWDPRDTHPSFAFTSAPTDVDVLPGEFDPTQALLIGWPSGISGLTSYFAELIEAAAPEVDTTVVYVDSNSAYNQILGALNQTSVDLDTVYFVKMDLDTIWIRDYGPLVVKTNSGGFRIIDLRYYYGRWDDDVVPTRLASAWNIPVSRPPIEGEGGNFQSDGAGSCITTDQMVYQNYNRGYTAQDIRTIFKKYLGCQTTVILPPLVGEGTGHVDLLATITAPKEVIVGEYSLSDDSTNAAVLDKAASMLQNAGFKVRRIPMPSNWDGNYRSYTNSLAIGNVVLVPTYSDDTRYEKQALSVFQKAYPYHTIVPIDSTDIITWAGATHCVTMTIGS